jgi:hypothetical protein
MSLRSLSCTRDQAKPFFAQGTIMSSGKRNLSCLNKQLFLKIPYGIIMSSRRNFFFSPKNMVVPWGNLSIVSLGT